MVALVLSLALALVTGTGAHSAKGHLPVRGVVIPGVSLAGVKVGDTEQRVKQVWGSNFTTCKYCSDATWLFEYRVGEPLGAAARFENGRVVAVFTLGSPSGWKTVKGLNIGDPINNVFQYYPKTGTVRCIGFDAVTIRTGNVVTAFYSAAGVVYGFALVAPSMTPCQ
jgi:hypothetical protein